jgi:hypothetical protein
MYVCVCVCVQVIKSGFFATAHLYLEQTTNVLMPLTNKFFLDFRLDPAIGRVTRTPAIPPSLALDLTHLFGHYWADCYCYSPYWCPAHDCFPAAASEVAPKYSSPTWQLGFRRPVMHLWQISLFYCQHPNRIRCYCVRPDVNTIVWHQFADWTKNNHVCM